MQSYLNIFFSINCIKMMLCLNSQIIFYYKPTVNTYIFNQYIIIKYFKYKKNKDCFLNKLSIINLFSEFKIFYIYKTNLFFQKYICHTKEQINKNNYVIKKILHNKDIYYNNFKYIQDQIYENNAINYSNVKKIFFNKLNLLSKISKEKKIEIFNKVLILYKKNNKLIYYLSKLNNICDYKLHIQKLQSLVHGDLKNENIIFTNTEAFFIDYECAYINDVIDDLLSYYIDSKNDNVYNMIYLSIKLHYEYNVSIFLTFNSMLKRHFYVFGSLYIKNKILSLFKQKQL